MCISNFIFIGSGVTKFSYWTELKRYTTAIGAVDFVTFNCEGGALHLWSLGQPKIGWFSSIQLVGNSLSLQVLDVYNQSIPYRFHQYWICQLQWKLECRRFGWLNQRLAWKKMDCFIHWLCINFIDLNS